MDSLASTINPPITSGSIAILAITLAAATTAELSALAGALLEGPTDISDGLGGRSGHGEVGEGGEEEGEDCGELHFGRFGLLVA